MSLIEIAGIEITGARLPASGDAGFAESDR
jgi:hypothetical protein